MLISVNGYNGDSNLINTEKIVAVFAHKDPNKIIVLLDCPGEGNQEYHLQETLQTFYDKCVTRTP